MRALGERLAASGYRVAVPDVPFDLAAFVRSVAASVDDHSVLVGFSAAGPRLFAVAEVARPAAIVFLDARLPVDGVTPDDDPALAAVVGRLPVSDDGTLPPWTSWWPDEVLGALVPDPGQRADLAAGCGRPPRAMFSAPIPAPPPGVPCGFVALGDGYAADAREAGGRGWPVVTLAGGNHLWPLTEPTSVADALVDVVGQLR